MACKFAALLHANAVKQGQILRGEAPFSSDVHAVFTQQQKDIVQVKPRETNVVDSILSSSASLELSARTGQRNELRVDLSSCNI